MAFFETLPLRIGHRTGVIRQATELDAAAVLALLRATAEESDFLARYADEIRLKIEDEARFLREQEVAGEHLFVVAELEERIVGSASLTGSSLRRFAHAAILGMSVLRSYWGLGIGRALLQATLDWADDQGLARLSLEVAETNVRAIKLYEAYGFAHEGRLRMHRRHDDMYVDSLVMARIPSTEA